MKGKNIPTPDSRRWKTRWLPAAGLIGVVLLVYFGGFFPASPPEKSPRKIKCLGDDSLSAPLFSLPDLQGNKVELASFKGKVILLEFWATWCGPCKEEIPSLNELHRKFQGEGLAVIGISLDRRAAEDVRKFLEKMNVEYLNLIGDDEVFENYCRMAGSGSLRAIPAAFLIDRQGRICKSFIGLTEKKILEESVQSVF